MIGISLVILATLPIFSSAFDCRYNHTAITARKTVILELENHRYIHIQNASYDIIPSTGEGYEQTSRVLGEPIYFIRYINFTGNLTENQESKTVSAILDNLRGYRIKNRQDGKCSVTFLESDSLRTDLTKEEQTAILRLAESCIESYACNFNLHEVDKDGDLYYQSTQSALNALVDFYFPRILNLFSTNGIIEIDTFKIDSDGFYFYEKNGRISGLDTIQRVSDIFIRHEGNKYIVQLGFRVSKLNLALNGVIVGYKILNTFGDFTAEVEGMTFKGAIVIDMQPSNCLIYADKFRIESLKNVVVNIPIFQLFTYSVQMNPDQLSAIERVLLNYINSEFSHFSFDCQKYVDQLPDVIG